MEPQSGDTPQGPAQPAPPLSENTKRPAAATPEKLVTPAARLSRRQSAEKGPPAVYEGSGSQRRRESRFRGTNQLIVPESVNADADPYRFLPKPAPRAAKAAVAAPRADDDAAEEPRGRLSFGAAAPPAPVSEVSEPAAAPAPAPAGRPSTGAFSDLGEDAAARSPSDLGAVARDDDAAPPPPPQLPRVTTSEETPAVWDSSHLQRAPSSGDADAFGCVGDLAAVFSDDAAVAPADGSDGVAGGNFLKRALVKRAGSLAAPQKKLKRSMESLDAAPLSGPNRHFINEVEIHPGYYVDWDETPDETLGPLAQAYGEYITQILSEREQ